MYFTDRSKAVSVHSSLVITCWERVGLLALLCVMHYCVCGTFPYGALSQVWYLIVLIPDLCLLTYFDIRFTGKVLRTLVELLGRACQAIQHVFSKPNLFKYDIKRREPGILCISFQVGSLFKLASMA